MEGHEKLCRVRGTAAGRPIDCLGQRGRSWGTADWSRISLTRSLGAWLDEGPSVVYSAVRPAGAESHADEAHWGALLDADGAVAIDDPRVSTTYDGDGHQRRVGLELWVGEEDDYPRRGVGPGAVRLLGRARAAAARLRLLRVDARRPRGRRALRRAAARLNLLRANRVRALNAPLSARSPVEPSSGIRPIWRPHCVWSKMTKFEAILPSRSVKWSTPSSRSLRPVPSRPWRRPCCVPLRRQRTNTSSPCSTIASISTTRSGMAANVASK